MFAALDLSLAAIGLARTVSPSGSGREVRTLKPRGEGVARLQDALNQVIGATRDVRLILIEGYSYKSEYQAHQLGELGGVIRLGLTQIGRTWLEIPPACVKKLATGNGNAKKDLVYGQAIRLLGYEGSSRDEADALWLLQAALIHYGLPWAAKLPQSHLEFLQKVQWPDLALEAAS